MSDPLICGARQLPALGGIMIPAPVGGLGLSDDAVDIDPDGWMTPRWSHSACCSKARSHSDIMVA
jgi:hypothetical protein